MVPIFAPLHRSVVLIVLLNSQSMKYSRFAKTMWADEQYLNIKKLKGFWVRTLLINSEPKTSGGLFRYRAQYHGHIWRAESIQDFNVYIYT